MKKFLILICFLSAFTFFDCSTSKNASQNQTTNKYSEASDNADNTGTLLDYLRKVPGVVVTGDDYNASVTIRGATSFSQSNEPLFVLDGAILTGGIQEAIQMVPIGKIKSVRALKSPSEKAIYGMRGANGIIKITLK